MSTSTRPYPRTAWFFKFCECVLAAVMIAAFISVMSSTFTTPTLRPYVDYVEPALLLLLLLGCLVYPVIWQRRERAGRGNSGLQHAWLQGIIRYGVAFSLSLYAFGKVFKTQLQSPGYRLDMPMGDVNGFGLTWYYYGHSYPFAIILALLQLGGSLLLLYRRTRLLGAVVLLPVMVNILLINLFFSIGSGALSAAALITLCLVFLLYLDRAKLKAAFWDLVDHLPSITLGNRWVKYALPLLPFGAGLTVILYLVSTGKRDTVINGSWNVTQLTRNGRIIPVNAWLTDTTAWRRVYFEDKYGCVFSPNPYRYKPDESLQGNYEFDSTKNTVRLMLYRSRQADKPDTLQATLSNRTPKAMRLRGVWWGDTLDMQLARLR